MQTALLIPGLDSLFIADKAKRWLEHGTIREALNEASAFLSDYSKQTENLRSFLQLHRRPHVADFDRMLISLFALQVGIGRSLIKQNVCYDLIVSCSHGDLARNVLAGVMSFQQAILALYEFALYRKHCPSGATANVRNSQLTPLTSEQKNWLREQGLCLTLWSPTHGTVAGTLPALSHASEQARHWGLKIKTVLPYPVHSPVMQPAVEHLKTLKTKLSFHAPSLPLFSTVYKRFLAQPEELWAEGLDGALSPILWTESLAYLSNDVGIHSFINLGPSNTLTGWVLTSPEFKHNRILDAWDLV